MDILSNKMQKEEDLKTLCQKENIEYSDLTVLLEAIRERDFSKKSTNLEEIINHVLEK